MYIGVYRCLEVVLDVCGCLEVVVVCLWVFGGRCRVFVGVCMCL